MPNRLVRSREHVRIAAKRDRTSSRPGPGDLTRLFRMQEPGSFRNEPGGFLAFTSGISSADRAWAGPGVRPDRRAVRKVALERTCDRNLADLSSTRGTRLLRLDSVRHVMPRLVIAAPGGPPNPALARRHEAKTKMAPAPTHPYTLSGAISILQAALKRPPGTPWRPEQSCSSLFVRGTGPVQARGSGRTGGRGRLAGPDEEKSRIGSSWPGTVRGSPASRHRRPE